jgi:hypothetical protein
MIINESRIGAVADLRNNSMNDPDPSPELVNQRLLRTTILGFLKIVEFGSLGV